VVLGARFRGWSARVFGARWVRVSHWCGMDLRTFQRGLFGHRNSFLGALVWGRYDWFRSVGAHFQGWSAHVCRRLQLIVAGAAAALLVLISGVGRCMLCGRCTC
jgi:hypothetical protein